MTIVAARRRYGGHMDQRTAPAVTDRPVVPESRDCTRCDGQQHVLAAFEGMGKYRCDGCELVVGFDLDAEVREFLIDRGLPGRYTRDVFGPVLHGSERRF